MFLTCLFKAVRLVMEELLLEKMVLHHMEVRLDSGKAVCSAIQTALRHSQVFMSSCTICLLCVADAVAEVLHKRLGVACRCLGGRACGAAW